MSAQILRHRSLSHRLPEGRLYAIFIAILAGVVLLLALALGEVYRQAERRAEVDASNLTAIIAEHLSGTLSRVHAGLEHLASTLPPEAFVAGNDERLRSTVERQLVLQAAHFPEILGYRAIDALGQVRYYSERGRPWFQVGDRDYFLALRDDPSLPLYIGQAVVGRSNGQLVLTVAVPVRDAKGDFRGIVTAPLNLDRLQAMFAVARLGEDGVLALWRTDTDHLVLRQPPLSREFKLSPSDGSVRRRPVLQRIQAGEQSGYFSDRSPFDGIERRYAFRRLDDYPFYIVAGIAAEDYLANWRMLVAAVGLFVLLLALALLRLLRLEREEVTAKTRLTESEARYRLLTDNSHDVIWTLDIASRRLTYVSPSVSALRGYTPEEALAQTLEQWLTAASASHLNGMIERHLKRIAAGDNTARVVTCELEQLCRDGSAVPTEVVVSNLFDAEGVPRQMLGISRDIRERKEAEQALQERNRQLQWRLDEITRLQAALREQAVRDSLTGLYNRRYLDGILEREVSRARREGSPLSLVMLDIDHFKPVNDTYGHPAGDEVLRLLAATLQADIRTEDTACRYGGEEFLILLPNMPLAAAVERAEGWRRAVAALTVDYGGLAIHFTISLGVAAYPEHGQTPGDLIRCADQALYRAKAAGRNRTLVYAAD
ncbi:MAG: diguanylate cyclase [Desulfobulbus sp.]|nr:diguanylate cyclase [Desulfobulbus sp.]